MLPIRTMREGMQIHRVRRWLSEQTRVAVVGHSRPDPDCIGSTLALVRWLRRQGAVAVPVNSTPSSEYDFIPGNEEMVREIPEGHAVCVVDCALAQSPGLDIPRPYTLIDHHRGSDHGDLCWVDASYSSTGEMLYDLMTAHPPKLDKETASCLYAAILGDTGGMRFPNTNARVLRIMSELAEHGADPAAMAEGVFMQRDYSAQVAAGAAMAASTMEEGGLLWARHYNSPGGRRPYWLSNELRYTKGARLTAMVTEYTDKSHVSLRSSEFDCEALAKEFGGGGHRGAAAVWLGPHEFQSTLLPRLLEVVRK